MFLDATRYTRFIKTPFKTLRDKNRIFGEQKTCPENRKIRYFWFQRIFFTKKGQKRPLFRTFYCSVKYYIVGIWGKNRIYLLYRPRIGFSLKGASIVWYKSITRVFLLTLAMAVCASAQFGPRDRSSSSTSDGPGSGRTVIRFMPSWTNTSAVMIKLLRMVRSENNKTDGCLQHPLQADHRQHLRGRRR